MGKYVDRNFIRQLTKKYYQQQRNHEFKCSCIYCQNYQNLLKEKER